MPINGVGISGQGGVDGHARRSRKLNGVHRVGYGGNGAKPVSIPAPVHIRPRLTGSGNDIGEGKIMPIAEVTDMKPESQIRTLKDICKKITETDDEWLENGNAELLLSAIIDALEEGSQDDSWGTEGWQHFFGYE